MGAGAKSDPSRVQISDISYTVYDPLARSVRRKLRLLGVHSGIPVVYSTEAPGDVKLLPLPEEEFQKGDVKELGVLEDFRVRILPVLGRAMSANLSHSGFFLRLCPARLIAIDIWSTRCDIRSLRARRETDFQSVTRQEPQEAVRKDES
jgi:hypothetical protein